MPSIRSTFSPTAPQTTFASPEEEAQLAAVGQRSVLEGTPAFGAGLRRSMLTMPAGLSDALGQTLEPLYPEAAQPLFDWATANRQQAAAIPMPVQNFDDVNGVGDLGSYVAGKMGENAMNVVPAVIGGVAARYGLRGAAMSPLMKTGVGAAAASFPQQMGEGVGALREDPAILANTTPGQRLAAATLYGAVTAPLEAPEEALLLNRAMGTGAAVKNVFKDGIKASMKDAAKHVAKAVPESALTEGVPEAVEQGLQQKMQGFYNPQRDTSKDAHDLKESFFGGWAAGGGTATVGRGADVAWAQGRGATDAIKGLLAPKTLPPGMAQADDRAVLDWDAQDNAERNSKAGALADSILNSDAADSLKQAATAFKDKVAAGANDAWTAMSDALGKHESVQRAKAGVDRFLAAAKDTYGDLHGEGKDAEFTAADRYIFGEMQKYLPPTSELAKPENTDRAAELYNYLKQYLINGTKEELPLHALEDDFGTPENLAEALGNMHGLLVRSGELEADDGFMSRIKASLSSGKNADFAMANLVRNHTALDVDQPTPHEAIAIAQQIKKLMAKYPEMSPEKRAKFDTALKDQFGEKNVDKVLEALGAQRPALQEESKVENEEGVSPENRTVFDNGPRQSFHGSGADGGMWNLGHADPKVRKEITARYHDALSKHKEQGEDVRSLTPDEYATVAGVPRADVAEQLGVTVDELKNHPARMLHVTEGAVGLAGDKLDLQTSDLVRLGKKTVKDTATKVDLGTAQQLRAALGQKDFKAQRKALQELGFGNLTSVEGVEGKGFFAKQNLNHRGEGRFTLHMKDGSEITMTSHELIKEMRGRENVDVKATRNGGAAEMLRHFSMGMSSILSNPDVKAIDVYNGGKGTKKQTLHTPQTDSSEVTAAELKQLQSAEHRNSFPEKFKQQLVDIAEAAKTATPEEKDALRKQYANIKAMAAHESDVFGAFGKFFKLGQLGGKAQYIHHGQRAAGRSGFDAQKDYATSMEALEQLEQDFKDTQADAEAKQKQADAIKARAAKLPAGAKKDKLKERAEELEQEADDLFAQAEALEEEAIEARAELESPANGFAQALEGGDKSDMAGSADGEVADMAAASQLASERKVRTHDESTGEALHPRGKPGEGGGPPTGKLSELVVRGLKMTVPSGVTGRDFTKPMLALLDKIAAAGKVSPGLANHFEPVTTAIGKAAQKNKFIKRLDPEEMTRLEAKFQRYLASALSTLADKGKAETTELRKAQLRSAYGKLKALHTESLGAGVFTLTRDQEQQTEKQFTELWHLFGAAKAEALPTKRFSKFMESQSHEEYDFFGLEDQNSAFVRRMSAAIREFLLRRDYPVKDTMFVIHENDEKAFMLYDPSHDVISVGMSAARTFAAAMDGASNSAAKAEFLISILHEAAHKIDYSVTVNGLPANASYLSGRMDWNGDLVDEMERLLAKGGVWTEFRYPLHHKLEDNVYAGEVFAQLFAMTKMFPSLVEAESPKISKFVKEVENAKDSEGQRAAIAGEKRKGFDKRAAAGAAEDGQVYVAKELHTRRAVGDREEVRDRDHADTGRAASENAERPEGTGVTPEEIKAVEDYVEKVLGPDVAVEFAKVLLDKKGKATAGSGQWYRDNGKAFVQLSLNAANPMSKAHHEAMHEFFQRLMDSNPDAAKVLSRAAAGAPIRRQLEQFFHNEPNRAAIMKQLDSSEHERVAYMFQLWAAGKLKVGDQTESWFKKVADLFRKVFGVLSNDQKAEAIMQAFHNGKMSEPNAVAEVLAKDVARNDALYAAVKQASLPLVAAMKRAGYSADGVLRGRGNKALQEIAEIFYNAPGDKGGISFMSARQQKEDQMLNRIKGIFAGADEKDTALVLEGLQTPGFKLSSDAKIRAIQERLVGKDGDGKTGFFKQMYDYLDEAGVPVEKRKNYFPRVWDVEAVQKNAYEFTKMVREDYHKATGKDMSAVEAATIQQSIAANKGADALTETEASIGFTPYMQAANARKLGFLTDERFQGFQSKDAIHILTTYVGHAVHRAEYARRFGNGGELLQDKLVEAAGIEADKFGKGGGKELETARKTVMDKYAADMKKFFADIKAGKDVERPRRPTLHNFIAEIAKTNPKLAKALVAEMNDPYKAVMAMEGTLGYDVNAKWRAFQANTIVYQNMRLLWMSLFSQFADPLGVLVRGGTINDAWDTFKRGAVGAVHGWRGTQATDEMSLLARNLGIVNANGILSQMGDAYSSVFLGKFAKKMNDRLFRINGVEAFTQGTRVGAMASGIGFITRHLTNPGEHSQRYMEELFGTGYKKGDIALTSDGKLDFTDRRIQDALMKYVDSCMLRPNAAMRPVWSSDPHYALFFHMKQFTYAFHKTIIDRAILEGKHGNYDPAFNLVLTYVPMMIAADFLRGILSNGGEEPPWKRKWGPGDYLASGVQRAGLLGVPQLGVDVLQWGPTELLGPAAQQVEKGIKTFNRSIAKDNALDRKAAATGRAADLAKAEKYDGVATATKRTIRDALPIGEFAKRATYDELVD